MGRWNSPEVRQSWFLLHSFENLRQDPGKGPKRSLEGLAGAFATRGCPSLPSEIAKLKWEHIDWEAKRISIVNSAKTEQHKRRAIRALPLLPQIETGLLKLHLEAEDRAEYVFPRVSGQTILRTYRERIIRSVGVKQWPKLWHNLRASGATDFARTLPSHVAAEICGHTEEIAKEHYWQVSDSDLDLAIKKLGNLPSVSIDSGKECPTVSQADSGQEGSDLSQVSIETQFIAICRLLSEVGLGNEMGDTELESVTSTMSTWRSNQLS